MPVAEWGRGSAVAERRLPRGARRGARRPPAGLGPHSAAGQGQHRLAGPKGARQSSRAKAGTEGRGGRRRNGRRPLEMPLIPAGDPSSPVPAAAAFRPTEVLGPSGGTGFAGHTAQAPRPASPGLGTPRRDRPAELGVHTIAPRLLLLLLDAFGCALDVSVHVP